MLESAARRAPQRRLRRFALAWCWRVAPEYFHDPDPNLFVGNDVASHWMMGFGDDMEDALQTAIRFTDGQATRQELRAAHRSAAGWAEALVSYDLGHYVVAANAANATSDGPFLPPQAPYMQADWTSEAHARDRAQQADLLREFVPPPSLWRKSANPSWLTWNNATVPNLAGMIAHEQRFDLMPILSDALEDAGCTNADILEHCRGPGPHVRGCWVVDLLLAKA